MTETKKTPEAEARLAAALKGIEPWTTPFVAAVRVLAADPTIAADLNDAPRLRAENERLRAALEQTANAGGLVPKEVADEARRILRYLEGEDIGITGSEAGERLRAALTEGSAPIDNRIDIRNHDEDGNHIA